MNSAVSPRSNSVRAICFCAAVLTMLSAAAILFVWQSRQLLHFGDAAAHLNIARRLWDGRNPGYEQIGTVWLPLPHLLFAPFTLWDEGWKSGLAGSIPSGAAWVVAGLFLFATLRRLWDVRAAAVGTAIFALNPNLLYLQAIPMTESIYFAAALGTLYFSVAQRPALAGMCTAAATLTRYEGWFLLPFVALYFLVSTRSWRPVLWFSLIAGLGPAYWLGHNWILYSDPLEFYRGIGSAKDIQKGLPYPGAHDWGKAMEQFARATRAVLGWPAVLMGGLGLLSAAWRGAGWPSVFLALPVLYYVINLHGGDSPIYIPEVYPFSHYNTRYALAGLPLVALLGAGLAARSRRLGVALPLVAVGWFAWNPVLAWNESIANSESRRDWTAAAADLLREHYRPGTGILLPFGDLTAIVQQAGIPIAETIHQGDKLEFDRSTQRPDLFLDTAWVIAQRGDAAAIGMRRAVQSGMPYQCVKLMELRYAPVLEVWRRGQLPP